MTGLSAHWPLAMPGAFSWGVGTSDRVLRHGKRRQHLFAGNGARGHHLCHQVIVPCAFHRHVGQRAQLKRLDQVVGKVRIGARLLECVDRCAGRASANELGFQPVGRGIGEGTLLPHKVSMSPDQVRSRVSVGLRVDEEDGLTDVRRHGTVAGQGADPAVEDYMGRRKGTHLLEGLGPQGVCWLA